MDLEELRCISQVHDNLSDGYSLSRDYYSVGADCQRPDRGEPDLSLLTPCEFCNRTFVPASLNKHRRGCYKSWLKEKDRSSKMEKEKNKYQTPYGYNGEKPILTIEQMLAKRRQRRLNWRVRHEEFMRAVHAARDYADAVASGNPLPPPPPPVVEPDLKQCPHCQRRFHDKAIERHLTRCREQSLRNNKERPSYQTMEAKRRLAVRLYYQPTSRPNSSLSMTNPPTPTFSRPSSRQTDFDYSMNTDSPSDFNLGRYSSMSAIENNDSKQKIPQSVFDNIGKSFGRKTPRKIFADQRSYPNGTPTFERRNMTPIIPESCLSGRQSNLSTFSSRNHSRQSMVKTPVESLNLPNTRNHSSKARNIHDPSGNIKRSSSCVSQLRGSSACRSEKYTMNTPSAGDSTIEHRKPFNCGRSSSKESLSLRENIRSFPMNRLHENPRSALNTPNGDSKSNRRSLNLSEKCRSPQGSSHNLNNDSKSHRKSLNHSEQPRSPHGSLNNLNSDIKPNRRSLNLSERPRSPRSPQSSINNPDNDSKSHRKSLNISEQPRSSGSPHSSMNNINSDYKPSRRSLNQSERHHSSHSSLNNENSDSKSNRRSLDQSDRPRSPRSSHSSINNINKDPKSNRRSLNLSERPKSPRSPHSSINNPNNDSKSHRKSLNHSDRPRSPGSPQSSLNDLNGDSKSKQKSLYQSKGAPSPRSPLSSLNNLNSDFKSNRKSLNFSEKPRSPRSSHSSFNNPNHDPKSQRKSLNHSQLPQNQRSSHDSLNNLNNDSKSHRRSVNLSENPQSPHSSLNNPITDSKSNRRSLNLSERLRSPDNTPNNQNSDSKSNHRSLNRLDITRSPHPKNSTLTSHVERRSTSITMSRSGQSRSHRSKRDSSNHISLERSSEKIVDQGKEPHKSPSRIRKSHVEIEQTHLNIKSTDVVVSEAVESLECFTQSKEREPSEGPRLRNEIQIHFQPKLKSQNEVKLETGDDNSRISNSHITLKKSNPEKVVKSTSEVSMVKEGDNGLTIYRQTDPKGESRSPLPRSKRFVTNYNLTKAKGDSVIIQQPNTNVPLKEEVQITDNTTNIAHPCKSIRTVSISDQNNPTKFRSSISLRDSLNHTEENNIIRVAKAAETAYFCQECGHKFPSREAKFCCSCGCRRSEMTKNNSSEANPII